MNLSIDNELVTETLTRFIREEMAKAGFSRAVVGLSGGIDSCTSLFLAARAMGKERVLGVCMPYRSSSPSSLEHARLAAKTAGCSAEVVEITAQIEAYFETFPDADQLRRGNKMARERMSILYDISKRDDALVVGTSNKTEFFLGYGTLYGDIACAINPLGDLYKTQVGQLARHLGVPEVIVNKTPSADLWTGQTDEDEIGFTYEKVDQVLYRYTDLHWSVEEIVADGFEKALVQRVHEMVRQSHYKRRLPVIAKLPAQIVNRVVRPSRNGCQ